MMCESAVVVPPCSTAGHSSRGAWERGKSGCMPGGIPFLKVVVIVYLCLENATLTQRDSNESRKGTSSSLFQPVDKKMTRFFPRPSSVEHCLFPSLPDPPAHKSFPWPWSRNTHVPNVAAVVAVCEPSTLQHLANTRSTT